MESAEKRRIHGFNVAGLAARARDMPGTVLFAVLALHLVVWSVLPILLSRNLELDLVEDLALGREWQLGYWKHPPLPWWIADLAYRIVGDIHIVYVLGPIAVVICLYAVWLLARELVGETEALVAVLALEGIHYYSYSAIKFAHDQVQLPFWALTGLFLYRAIARQKALDWLLAGAFLAGAFWSKYAAFTLAATAGLILLLDPYARRVWRTPGPWLMGLAFLVVLGPNLWWLVDSGFMPFRYVDARAKVATNALQYLTFPFIWTGGQIFFVLPALGLLAVLYARAPRTPRPIPDAQAAFARRYVAALAIGPFLLTTLIAAMLGRLPVAMWGYPLWSFMPLAIILWLGPFDRRRLQPFVRAFLAVFIFFVVAAAVEPLKPLVRERPSANQFPGQALADTVTRAWHARFRTPLAYVGGTEFATNNVAVYGADRPHVIVHGRPELSPWIDVEDVRRRGGVLVWEEELAGPAQIEQWQKTFPDLEVQPMLELPRQSRFRVRPTRIGYAFIPPGG